MKYRNLGHSLTVSAIGIGCMPMIKGGNILYGDVADLDEATATIHRAIDLGVTFFDTAQIYGPFTNEELVGAAIKGKRAGLVIATKFGFRFEGNQITGVDGSPANARARARLRCGGWVSTPSTCSTSTALIPPCRSRTR